MRTRIGNGLVPGLEETAQHVGPVRDHVVGRKDDMGDEGIDDIAEARRVIWRR